DPEPPRHIDELGAGSHLAGHTGRLKRHAADRAGAGLVPPDLRMHRTGPDRAWRHGSKRRRLGRLQRQVFRRVGNEFLAALGIAEEIIPILDASAMLRLLRIDAHAADGVFDSDDAGGSGVALVMIVAVVGHGASLDIYPLGV